MRPNSVQFDLQVGPNAISWIMHGLECKGMLPTGAYRMMIGPDLKNLKSLASLLRPHVNNVCMVVRLLWMDNPTNQDGLLLNHSLKLLSTT